MRSGGGLLLVVVSLLLVTTSLGQGVACPITDTTTHVYSVVPGVGNASKIWVSDFLWWWKTAEGGDPSIEYLALEATDLQACDLASYPNLKVYLNPGGDAFQQLSSLGPAGAKNIVNFVQRDQSSTPSGYAGFCAGAYIASTGYLWETLYEGTSYFSQYHTTPPLGLFPHAVEGSIVDINDEQYGDANGILYRLVNVSNGHQMLYYGGSTWGWNAVQDYNDPKVQPIIYYEDFYGYHSPNIPAAWTYDNLVLTSVHPEADNCTKYDCPANGTIPTNNILQNRAWLATYINTASQSHFSIPTVPVAPQFNTTKPHSAKPKFSCYDNTNALFCDYFDWTENSPPPGLFSWQRNQSTYNTARPWNTTYTNFGQYGTPHSGNGFAIVSTDNKSNLTTCIGTQDNTESTLVSFAVQGKTLVYGGIIVSYALYEYNVDVDNTPGIEWTVALSERLTSQSWQEKQLKIPNSPFPTDAFLYLRFECLYSGDGYCAIDSVLATPGATLLQ